VPGKHGFYSMHEGAVADGMEVFIIESEEIYKPSGGSYTVLQLGRDDFKNIR
jgi:hypothetical protein